MGAILPIVAGLASAGLNAYMTYKQNENNKAWQEKMYNQYQSPQALVDQYRQAGLNPMLMNGSNLGSNFNQPGSQNPYDLMSGASAFAQIANLNAQTANTQADTRLKEIEGEFKPEIFAQDLKNKKLDYDNTLAGIHKLEQDIKESDQRTRLYAIQQSLTEAEIKQVLASTDETIVRTTSERLRQEGIPVSNQILAAELLNKQMDYAVKSFEIALMKSQKANYDAQTGEITARTHGIDLDNVYKLWQQEFREATGTSPDQPLWNAMTSSLGTISMQIGDAPLLGGLGAGYKGVKALINHFSPNRE